MCNKVVTKHLQCIRYMPDQFKSNEICAKAFEKYFCKLEYFSDQYKSQEMCNKVISQHPLCLEYVPDQYKSQEMCSDKFKYSEEVYDIPDCFKTPEMIENGGGCCDSGDDEFSE